MAMLNKPQLFLASSEAPRTAQSTVASSVAAAGRVFGHPGRDCLVAIPIQSPFSCCNNRAAIGLFTLQAGT